MMAAAVLRSVLGSEPYTAQDWVLIIGAIVTGLTTLVSSIVAAVVAVRNGNRGKAIATRIEDVHDCLHRQAENVSALITATPGAEEAK